MYPSQETLYNPERDEAARIDPEIEYIIRFDPVMYRHTRYQVAIQAKKRRP